MAAREETGGGRKAVVLLLVLIGIIVAILVGLKAKGRVAVNRHVDGLGSKNELVRKDAYDNLLALGDGAIPHIRRALKEQKGVGLGVAALLAGKLGDKKSAPRLMELVSDSDIVVRRNAISALGYLGATEAAPEIIKSLDAKDRLLRRNAAWAVGRMGEAGKPAVPKLIKMFSDKKQPRDVRQACANSLGALKDPSAAIPLTKVLDPNEYDLAVVAVRALGDIGSKDAVPKLSSFLMMRVAGGGDYVKQASPDNIPPEVRKEVIVALRKIGGPKAKAAIKRCAETTESTTLRKLAQEALKEMEG